MQATLQIVFDSASSPAIVALVDTDSLGTANGRLSSSQSGAANAGAGLAGLLLTVALLVAARRGRNAPRWTIAIALGLRQGEVLGLRWNDLVLSSDSAVNGALAVRRQLQRAPWKHGCPDLGRCVTRGAGTSARRAADCPQRWGSGLFVSEPKSAAGQRTLTLPASLTTELCMHRTAQREEQLASEIWEHGPDGGWVFPDVRGGPTSPQDDRRDFKKLCTAAGVPPKRLHDLRHSAATITSCPSWTCERPGQCLVTHSSR